MRLIILFILFIFLFNSNANGQERYYLVGKTIANNNAVENVHVINLNTSVGTISSSIGLFRIPVKVGDTLLFSSLIHQKIKIGISEDILDEKKITIVLTPKVEALDEIKFTGLTGNLERDLQKKPADSIPELGWKYSVDDLNVTLNTDEDVNQTRVNAENFVNPIPGGGAAIGLPDKQLIRERRLKRTLKLKKDFPDLLIKEFGISYFTITLGIKEEDIPNFISFCEPKSLFEKYRSNNILEVIEILKKESAIYHEFKD